MNLRKTTKLALCFAGIFACYFYYGIIQEKITRGSYGLDKERYLYTVFLVFCQCVINAAFAKGMLLLTSDGTPSKTPNKLSFLCGCTYVGAMLASNASLKWVNYPTQVLGKSCKPITVMILGVFFAGKRYNSVKYLAVLMIVCGVALFMFKDGKSSANETVFGVGEFLLLVSLTLDGLTGVYQEKMRGYATKPHYMMMALNLSALVVMSVWLMVTGEIWQGITFCTKHPQIVPEIITFSLASALGQNFIYITVTEFGPLVCSIITTTRKFFTILGSVILFGNALLTRQWVGTMIVFAGLALDSLYGKTHKPAIKA